MPRERCWMPGLRIEDLPGNAGFGANARSAPPFSFPHGTVLDDTKSPVRSFSPLPVAHMSAHGLPPTSSSQSAEGASPALLDVDDQSEAARGYCSLVASRYATTRMVDVGLPSKMLSLSNGVLCLHHILAAGRGSTCTHTCHYATKVLWDFKTPFTAPKYLSYDDLFLNQQCPNAWIPTMRILDKAQAPLGFVLAVSTEQSIR